MGAAGGSPFSQLKESEADVLELTKTSTTSQVNGRNDWSNMKQQQFEENNSSAVDFFLFIASNYGLLYHEDRFDGQKAKQVVENELYRYANLWNIETLHPVGQKQ